MIARFFLIAAALSTISISAIPAHADFSAASPQATLDQVFQEFQVTDLSKPEIQTLVVEEPGTCSPFYYVEMRFPGNFENQPYQIELDLQTLTQENMNRIAKAIEDNYPLHGFPECMKSDSYDTQNWISDELKKIVMIPASFKGDHHTCFGSDFLIPYTKCVDVRDLYPSSGIH